jgi:predicted nucleic acid-binding protein
VSVIVLDTDVSSALLRGRLSDPLRARLAGHTLAVTFVTVGELTKWTHIRSWGPARLDVLNQFLGQVVVLPYSVAVAETWGALQARAQRRGRPRPANDTWIAACCLVRSHPLATLNLKDFADFAHYDGLDIVGYDASA